MLPDFDTTDPPNPDEEYRAVIRALRRTRGFGIKFIICSPAKGMALIQQLQVDLPQKQMDYLCFNQPVPDGNLYRQVKDRLAVLPALDILFIQGLEYSLYDYEETKRRFSGWTSQDIYNYSWKGVPPIMQNLNWMREDFRDSLPPVCLVFLIPRFVEKYFIHRAPDFFDWRSGLFEFPTDPETLNQESQLALGDYNEYLTWTSPQRVQKILELKELLAEPHQQPSRQVELLFELGNLFNADEHYEAAIASFDRALTLQPGFHAAWNNRGIALDNLGRYGEAIASYDRALALQPNDYRVWSNRAIAEIKLGNSEEASRSSSQALEAILLANSTEPSDLETQVWKQVKAELKLADQRTRQVADRIAREVERTCSQGDRPYSIGRLQPRQIRLAQHRIKKFLLYYRLGSRQGRIELQSTLSTIVFRHFSGQDATLDFHRQCGLIEEFLQNFYIETIQAFRQENHLPADYSPRSRLELAEYMAFTEHYAKRRVSLPNGRSQQLIVLRTKAYHPRSPTR